MAELIRDAFRTMRARLTQRLASVALYSLTDGSDLGTTSVPRHIAFVMDGNRRYADREGSQTIEGHVTGYDTLLDVLQYCLMLRVRTVSVYAFSIDNYTRSEEEVGSLMKLMEEKLWELEGEAERLRADGVKVRVLGDLSLAPRGVREAARRVMEATAENDACVLNVMFSYTASEELLRAGRMAARMAGPSVAEKRMEAPLLEVATKRHVDEYLYASEDVDLLIRTSGERRLSDFMLRQSRCCVLHFSERLWPEFGLVDFLEAMMAYQRQARVVLEAREVLEWTKMESFARLQRGDETSKKQAQEGTRSPSSVLSVEDGVGDGEAE